MRAPCLALRRFRPPLAVAVQLRGQCPARISCAAWSAEVAWLAGPWRLSGEWWDSDFARDEWDVAVEGASAVALLRICRDHDRWFVDGAYD